MANAEPWDLQIVEWRSVRDWEGIYEVANFGMVRSLDRVLETSRGPRRYKGKILTPSPNPVDGRLQLTFSAPGRGLKTVKVHKLVAEAFLGPCPEGMEVLHNNGNHLDNRAANMRYGTHLENMHDAIAHGTFPFRTRIGALNG